MSDWPERDAEIARQRGKEADTGVPADTPLDYLLAVVRDTSETPARRMQAADKAAPYVHPKLTHTVVEDRGAMRIADVLADILACRQRLIDQGVIDITPEPNPLITN